MTTLTNVLLPDGRRADLVIAGGRIAAIEPPTPGAESGDLILPGLVDGHIHLDKTLLGLPWQPHRPGASVAERIKAEKALRRELKVPVEERARHLVRQCAGHGTVAMRSHVDIDDEVGLDGLQALLRLREQVRDLVEIQLVAFPQSGVTSLKRGAELLDAAVAEGADLVGGLDPAGIDNDVEGQLAIVFGIAERRAVGIDIHLHDPGPLGAWELRRIAERSAAAGLQGRVAVSHAWALGEVDDAEFGRTAAALARGGVAIMTAAPGPFAMPPVKRLVAEGVTVFAGSDNIRDAWSPHGNGDMLERATLIAHRQGFATDDDLALAFHLVTAAPAKVLGLKDHGIAVGSWADLVAVPAAHLAEAVVAHPRRLVVMKRGVLSDGGLGS